MRRKVGLFVLVGLVLPLAMAAGAHAQGAVLEITPQSGPPGSVISVSGAGFTAASTALPPPVLGEVLLRLSTRDAPALKTALVDSGNRISTTFVIPAGTPPGEYLLLGTETSVRGRHLFGTPARAKLRVTLSAAAAAAPSGGRSFPLAFALAATTLALILLAGGTLAIRRLRAPHRPLGSNPTHSAS